MTLKRILRLALPVLFGMALFAPAVQAQDKPPERVLRSYIPPDQLVSFLPSTPMATFLELIDPIMRRLTGKQVIDPEARDIPIGVTLSSSHFFDAFELVLYHNGLAYRETDRYFMVQEAPPPLEPGAVPGSIADGLPEAASAAPALVTPADIGTRQVEIDAILFEVNHTKAKDIGFDWNTIVGEQQNQGGSGGSATGGSSEEQGSKVSFFVNSKDIFRPGGLISGPSQISFADLNSIIRLAESKGIGETIASPSVNVQSGEEGRIQVGSDIPVQTRDYSGNTVTQFFSTGVIIEVTPTLLSEPTADTLGAPLLDFIHLDVKVEKSGSRPSASGPVIDRSSATTQVTMIDGEQIVIGGLFTTEESYSRSGIPVLKDLPGWFFGLRYLFGRTQRSVSQKELVIVLQAHVIESILTRAGRAPQDNLLEQRRDQIQAALERFNARAASNTEARRRELRGESEENQD